MTDHLTRFRITGRYVDRNGKPMTKPGDGRIERLAQPYLVAHRPLEIGVVYEAVLPPPAPGAHLLDRDDSRRCAVCNPTGGRLD